MRPNIDICPYHVIFEGQVLQKPHVWSLSQWTEFWEWAKKYEPGMDDYEQAYNNGYDDGYEDKSSETYDEGYECGREDMRRELKGND